MSAYDVIAFLANVAPFGYVIALYVALGLPLPRVSPRQSMDGLNVSWRGLWLQASAVCLALLVWQVTVFSPLAVFGAVRLFGLMWFAPIIGIAVGFARFPPRWVQQALLGACMLILVTYCALGIREAVLESSLLLGYSFTYTGVLAQYQFALAIALFFAIGVRAGWSLKLRLAQREARVVRTQALNEFNTFYDRLVAREEAAA